jgi:ketosteroid isomerase-like protein
MSEENVEIVRRIYDQIPGSPEPVRRFFGPDYEMDLTDFQVADIGVVRAFDAVDRAVRPCYETFESFHIEIEELIHADEEHVVASVHDGGRLRGSDSEVQTHRFHVWTFRDGRIVRFSSHFDRNRALEAAGLRE